MAQPINTGISYEEYNTKRRLPEQEQAEILLLTRKHFVLGWAPGKSKSYPVIHSIIELERRKGRPIRALIMSDAACIKNMWKAEIAPQKILPKETYFVTDRTAIGEAAEALVNTKWDVIVVDECQSLRSGVTRKKSQYSKLVYALTKKTEYVWGMTGTLSGNNNIEPWCVLHNLNIAGMGNINPYNFKQHYCHQELTYGPFGNFLKPTKLNDKGEELLSKAYEAGVMFLDYDESDDMPPLDIQTKIFKVPATGEYKNALNGILKLGDHESTTIKAIALQKAQQALNGFLYYDDETGDRQTYQLKSYTNPKLQFVVNECRLTRTIVGYRFQEDGRAIETSLTVNKISWTNDTTEFRTGQYQVLVLQCSKGKAANLQLCQNIIYYTADFSFISYKQFIHRTWRRGQTEPCRVTFLVNDPEDKHQVELRIWESLQAKENIHDMLMRIKRA